MKRHEALQPISRDHHEVLMLARDLRRLGEDPSRSTEAARASLRRQWAGWMGEFFEASAEALSALSAAAELHERARDGAGALLAEAAAVLAHDGAPRVALTGLGGRLRDEVRWRERVLFPALERSATPDELALLGDRWSRVEAGRARSKGSC